MKTVQEVFKDADIDKLTLVETRDLLQQCLCPQANYYLHKLIRSTFQAWLHFLNKAASIGIPIKEFIQKMENLKLGVFLVEPPETDEQKIIVQQISNFIEYAGLRNIKINSTFIEFMENIVEKKSMETKKIIELADKVGISVLFIYSKFYEIIITDKIDELENDFRNNKLLSTDNLNYTFCFILKLIDFKDKNNIIDFEAYKNEYNKF